MFQVNVTNMNRPFAVDTRIVAIDRDNIELLLVNASLCNGDLVPMRRAVKRALRDGAVQSFKGVEGQQVFVAARKVDDDAKASAQRSATVRMLQRGGRGR